MEKRVIIAIVLSIAVLYGYSFLMPQPPAQKVAVKSAEQAAVIQGPASVQAPQPQTAPPAALPATAAPARDVTVDTDLYRAVFSSRGGTLKSLVLKKYHDKAGPGGKEVTLV